MYWANNSNGERIHIDSSSKSDIYYCPACGNKLIRKIGRIKASHFAHRNNDECDPWYYGNKGEWHRHMQSLFKPDQQEKVITKGEQKHIADVYLKGGRVIEFQHSPISGNEFAERSSFYYSATADGENWYLQHWKPNMIWVFDCVDKDIYADTTDEKVCSFYWKRKKKIFETMDELSYRTEKEKYRNGELRKYKITEVAVYIRISLRPYSIEKKESEFYDECGEYQCYESSVYEFIETSERPEVIYVRLWKPWSRSNYMKGNYYTEQEFEEALSKMSVITDKI